MHTPVLSWQRCPGDAISGDGVIGESCRNGSTSCTGSTGWTSYTGWRAYVLPLFQKNPDILNQVSISKMSWGTTLPIWHYILQKPHILSTRWPRKNPKRSERRRRGKIAKKLPRQPGQGSLKAWETPLLPPCQEHHSRWWRRILWQDDTSNFNRDSWAVRYYSNFYQLWGEDMKWWWRTILWENDTLTL